MKVLLIIISLSGIPTFKYYLGNNYILFEHLNPLTGEKSFRLLQINEHKIHVIDENFSKRTVESIDFSSKGKWTSSSRRSTLVKKSAIYFLNGRECINKEFEIIIPSDSPINIFSDNKDRYRTLIEVFCRLPIITSYLTDDRGLNFLSIYEKSENGFNFFIKSYYQDSPEIILGKNVDKIEELVVEENFFIKFLSVPVH